MTAPAQTLELIEIPITEIARPNHSLILADRGFMSTLTAAEVEGAGLAVIKDAVGLQAAASLQARVTKAQAMLKKQRLDLIRPYNTLIDAINLAAKAPDARLETLKQALGQAQTVFNQEQRRMAEEAEAKRLKDLADLEAKLAKEKQEAADKAAKLAEEVQSKKAESDRIAEAARLAGLPVEQPVVEEDWDEAPAPAPVAPQKTETEKQIEAVRYAPAPVIAKASGVREVVALYPHCQDINQVPDAFVKKEFKLAAVQATFCRGWKDGDPIPVCAGVRFEIQRGTQSTGKAEF